MLKRLYLSNLRARRLYDEPTQCSVGNLALSPSDIANNTSMGVASSSNMDSMYYDGDDTLSFGINPEHKRGADIISTWEASQTASAKVKSLNFE